MDYGNGLKRGHSYVHGRLQGVSTFRSSTPLQSLALGHNDADEITGITNAATLHSPSNVATDHTTARGDRKRGWWNACTAAAVCRPINTINWEFDAIVGNPPWVRWSSLPEAYRNRVKAVCLGYDIFSKTKHHGGNELDISAMITYTTGDKWLKHGGKLAFVITQAVFQNPSSSGFRNFRIDPNGKAN